MEDDYLKHENKLTNKQTWSSSHCTRPSTCILLFLKGLHIAAETFNDST